MTAENYAEYAVVAKPKFNRRTAAVKIQVRLRQIVFNFRIFRWTRSHLIVMSDTGACAVIAAACVLLRLCGFCVPLSV